MSILHRWSNDFPLKKPDINNLNINNLNNHILDIIQNTRQLTAYYEKNFSNHKFRRLKEGLSLDIKNLSDLSDLSASNNNINYDYLRESGHFIGDKLAVYAQVITNKDIYEKHQDKLQNLNNNPIGPTWLFLDKDIIRSEFLFKSLSPTDTDKLYKSAVKWGMKSPIIARESDFIKKDKDNKILLNLKIIEVFDVFM
jgi:chorismate-pyruvate lyase